MIDYPIDITHRYVIPAALQYSESQKKGISGFLIREVVSRILACSIIITQLGDLLSNAIIGTYIYGATAYGKLNFRGGYYPPGKFSFSIALIFYKYIYNNINPLLSINLFLKPCKFKEENSKFFNLNYSALTYTFSGGRFGDNLMVYLHAKYLANKYNFKLLYKPFEYSDQLKFHNHEMNYHSQNINKFKHVTLATKDWKVLEQQPSTPTLYTFEAGWGADYNDPSFKALIADTVKPIKEVPRIKLPTDRVSIALHVRNGGGFDSQMMKNLMPTKFPPESFYIDAIRQISEYYKNQPLHAHIFTDDPNPTALAKKLKDQTQGIDITFDHAKEVSHTTNIIEDWYNISLCDVLVRPDSSYSWSAEIIGNPHVTVQPKAWYINKDVNTTTSKIDSVFVVHKIKE